MIEANETDLPWEEGESARWIRPADNVTSFEPQIMTLSFNCAVVPEICVSIFFGVDCLCF